MPETNDRLLAAASHLDDGDPAAAWRALSQLPVLDPDSTPGGLALSLVRRTGDALARKGDWTGAQMAALGHYLTAAQAAVAGGHAWDLLALADRYGDAIGDDAFALLIRLLPGTTLSTCPVEVQTDLLSRVLAVGDCEGSAALWTYLLAEAADFVPDYWSFQALAKAHAASIGGPFAPAARAMLEQTGRADLAPLTEVWLLLLAQRDFLRAMQAALALEGPEHRRKVAQYLLGASRTLAEIELAVAAHTDLSGPNDTADRALMRARLAVAQGDWQAAELAAAEITDHGQHGHAAQCLLALARAHLGQSPSAETLLDGLRRNARVPWFLRGRAALIGMSQRLLSDGAALPGTMPAPALPVMAGRPLAQALWVGPKLRWIEELSIRSFLRNGWRYQLYVYEVPGNVPDGVELMDAAAILPRSDIFAEGAGSGLHKGSIGAFSDLFRYALLAQRGGLWTDTDVINLDRFEPDGLRLISTEVTDAGIIGPNGAMMAAPAGCPLQQTALARARSLRDRGDMHFARIGPELLAELLWRMGPLGYALPGPEFLNPLGWMETGRLLAPFADVAALPVLKTARNIHVYTETWRLIGLGLNAPPEGESFLGALYARLSDQTDTAPVRAILEAEA